MTPQARRIASVTVLIAAALVGLIAVQVLLLHRAYTQELRLFDLRVDAALRGIVEALNTREMLDRTTDLSARLGEHGDRMTDMLLRLPAGQWRLALIDKVLEQYHDAARPPAAERLRAAGLASVMSSMERAGRLPGPVVYGVLDAASGSFVVPASPKWTATLRASAHRTRLFPDDPRAEPLDLVVHFPGRRLSLAADMAGPGAAAGIFLLTTIACFVVTLAALARQRRYGMRLTEFVNNMAHAFKTPLSTLALTGAALGREEVQADAGRVEQYGLVVREESGRLRRQVERILEMAVIENEGLGLARQPLDLHDIVDRAAERFRPEAERRNGRILAQKGTPFSRLDADELHLRGVLDNLIDNALRYNRREPVVVIGTTGSADEIRLAVEDNGVGIQPRDLGHVFEKYFRVARGLQHDAAGFGLGLSYVRWVVEAHGGTIDVRSRIDEGTVFEIRLPLGTRTNRPRRRLGWRWR